MTESGWLCVWVCERESVKEREGEKREKVRERMRVRGRITMESSSTVCEREREKERKKERERDMEVKADDFVRRLFSIRRQSEHLRKVDQVSGSKECKNCDNERSR